MEDKDIYSSLGRLGAQVESLTKTISEMRAEDKEYREEVKQELAKIKVAVVLIEESEPIIRDIKPWRKIKRDFLSFIGRPIGKKIHEKRNVRRRTRTGLFW